MPCCAGEFWASRDGNRRFIEASNGLDLILAMMRTLTHRPEDSFPDSPTSRVLFSAQPAELACRQTRCQPRP